MERRSVVVLGVGRRVGVPVRQCEAKGSGAVHASLGVVRRVAVLDRHVEARDQRARCGRRSGSEQDEGRPWAEPRLEHVRIVADGLRGVKAVRQVHNEPHPVVRDLELA
jgi:hypothetical protein